MSEPDLILLPRTPTRAMLYAACNAMRERQEAMGDACTWLSNREKARLRWEAMVRAWEARDA